ncbi:MAG TPA: hypothetical protein VHJ18_08925 [Streptosporangiaceae bacterium]|nr:hypothetical protein [Streptosporangiaceae bacterium]
MATNGSDERKLTQMVKSEGFSFGPAIVAEARHTGVQLALALALVEQESGFRNIFGCDSGHQRSSAPWCHQDVTHRRVQELITFVDRGGVSNGVGLTQLTSIDLIKQAEAEGGAHTVDAQCRVGFRYLHDLIERHHEREGIGAYNGGEGDPNMRYADSVLALRAKWQSRINHALGGNGVSPPGDAEVHRDLILTTPYTEGPDIFALQRAVNNRARELPFTDADLTKDGQLGLHTISACGRVAFALGLSEPDCSAIKAGTLVQVTQKLIRDPSKLNAAQRQRAAARLPELQRRYEARKSGARAAVRWARSKIGAHENPAGSNWGKPVQEWITFTGYDGPVFWCGCFVAFAVVKQGGANVPDRMRLGFHEYINEDAMAGRNGFDRAVSVDQARPGDIATFNFKHIGLVVGRTKDGLIHTIDGNTSASDGSNPNGGEVAEHRRPVSEVLCVGRLRY